VGKHFGKNICRAGNKRVLESAIWLRWLADAVKEAAGRLICTYGVLPIEFTPHE
jgi:hypothetical protein